MSLGRHLAVDQEVLPYEFYKNPYPFYREVRSKDPVHWSDSWNCWLVTQYKDVARVLRDWRQFSSVGRSARFMSQLPETLRKELRPLEENFTSGLISSDPPQHERLRALVGKAFTLNLIEDQRPHIQSIVDGLLDAVQEEQRMDVIKDFAYLLPTTVIAQMLGVPLLIRDQFNQWVDVINSFLGTRSAVPEKATRAQESLFELTDYFRQLLVKRRQHPQNDLMSRLATTSEGGDQFNEQEILATCQTLLTAGYESTMGLIGNGLLWLMRSPDQFEELKSNPSLIQSAVEEFIRFDSPVQRMLRVVREDVEFGGKKIRKGQLVAAMIGAANRDPEQFADPDRLDITRSNNRHIGFGVGIHFCLGAPLARVEGEIAINTILRRFPNLRLVDEEPEWRPNILLRNLKSFPVEW